MFVATLLYRCGRALANFFGRTALVCGFLGEAVFYHLPHNLAVVNPRDSLRFGFLVQEVLLFFPQVSEDYFVWSFPDRVHHTVRSRTRRGLCVVSVSRATRRECAPGWSSFAS